MSEKPNKTVTIWLFFVVALVSFLVVFGGYVRLTRSGLSMVEWHPISGVLPPIGEEAWQQEFARYQQSPEFQTFNKNMTVEGFKGIFYLEWFHRLVARIAGLTVALPIFFFFWKGMIPRRKWGVFIAIGLLFAFQGWLGWYMVSSGLVDEPHVSHFRLTFHLLTALLLLGLTFWAALDFYFGFPEQRKGARKSTPLFLDVALIAILLIQIAYGGLVAGLKAGWLSNRWPLMGGHWIPPEWLSVVEPWWQNLISTAITVHFVHRWFAFAVLIMAAILYLYARKQHFSQSATNSIIGMVALVSLQIVFGISVIWFSVPIWLALLHQFTALLMYVLALFITYQTLHDPEPDAARSK